MLCVQERVPEPALIGLDQAHVLPPTQPLTSHTSSLIGTHTGGGVPQATGDDLGCERCAVSLCVLCMQEISAGAGAAVNAA